MQMAEEFHFVILKYRQHAREKFKYSYICFSKPKYI